MRRVHAFHGGVHPPENKAQSLAAPIQPAGIPPQLVLPLAQHIGAPAQPVVRVGQAVRGGELLAEADGFVSVPVHAPTSGTVSAIEERPVPHPSGLPAPCIVIDTDGADAWAPLAPLPEAERADPTKLRERIQGAGIAGMGGAGFPTAVKLSPGPGKTIETLIINGTECEPYITADDTLMRERAGDIVAGTRILQKGCGLLGIAFDKRPEQALLVAVPFVERLVGGRGAFGDDEEGGAVITHLLKHLVGGLFDTRPPFRLLGRFRWTWFSRHIHDESNRIRLYGSISV